MTIRYYSDVTITLDGKSVGAADAIAEMFGVARLPPSQPRGHITIPYGILGPIRLQGIVDAAAWQVTETGATGAFQMANNELERAVSMAVQRAIMNWHRRVAVIGEAQKEPTLYRMASKVHTRYRGERKERRAMRRLLRAAGVLGEKR